MSPPYLFNIVTFLSLNSVWIVAPLLALILIAFVIRILWRTLRENEKLKYEFITIIAHKFRTPLTHIKWISEELAQTTTDPPTKDGLEEIRKADQSLIGLTTTLIELTDADNKQGLYTYEKTDLCAFVKTIGEAAKRTFQEKNVFFSVVCDGGPVSAKIDKPRMEFVVQTLMDNALTYTPAGKTVQVGVSLESKGRKAIITVADNGIGIRPSDMKRIFHKFFRAGNAKSMDTEGFGVGLYLAQSVGYSTRRWNSCSSTCKTKNRRCPPF